MVDFAGWSMPVQYASIVDEHLATRRAAGLFDVSHMGRLSIDGPGSQAWLESLLTRRVGDMTPGQCRYTLVTSDGGSPSGLAVLDDALVAREDDAADASPRKNSRRVSSLIPMDLAIRKAFGFAGTATKLTSSNSALLNT
jgi:glycine cleavage system aminomethyltransferase T